MDTFKTRLELHMVRAGLNPTSLSRKAGLNTTGVRDILKHKGDADPRMSTFIKLCLALDVEPHILSPELANLYSPDQRELLAAKNGKDEKDQQVQDG